MQGFKKHIALFILVSFILQTVAIAYPLQKGDKVVIAIVDFKNTSRDESLDYLEKAIPESIITSMAKGGRLEIVERSRLQDAISEMKLGMSGVVDEQTAVEVGRAVGANAILVGSFVRIGSMIQINARLIDVETSRIIKADSKRGRVGEEIFTLMDQTADSMEDQLVGQHPSKQIEFQHVTSEDLQAQQQTSVKRPVYKKWWFWTIIGVGVAGGTAYALSSAGGNDNTSAVSISIPLP